MNGDFIALPNGARIYANCGIFGIGPDLQVYEGYDGGISLHCYTETSETRRLTSGDMVWLCNAMESRWARLREKHLEKMPSDPIPDPWEE